MPQVLKNPNDYRCLKTRKAIKMAFIALLERKDINDITITTLTREAEINRRTFYLHYQNVSDVIEDIENEIINRSCQAISGHDFESIKKNPCLIVQEVREIIAASFGIYRKILLSESNLSLILKIKDVIKQKLVKEILETGDADATLLPYAIDFLLGGMLTVFYQWYIGDRTIPFEQIANAVCSLSINTANALFHLKPADFN